MEEAEEEIEISRGKSLGRNAESLFVLEAWGMPGASVQSIQEAAQRTQRRERRLWTLLQQSTP